MKQLTGMDAGFLYMETPTTFGHVSSLAIYDRPDDEDFKPYETFRAHIEARLPLLEPFRRRLVEVPFQMDHPWWVEDPAFDLDFHVRHIGIPPPGSDIELADQVARISSRPCDRARPLWEAYVIEGLESGRWATLIKIHHATIDGAAGAEMLTMMLSPDKDQPVPELGAVPATERVPSPEEMVGRTMLNFASRPERFMKAQMRAMREASAIAMERGPAELTRSMMSMFDWAGQGTAAGQGPAASAPPTPFNKSITASRRFSFRSTRLSDVNTVKNAAWVTFNEVVMAVCGGALRRYLRRHNMLTDRPLQAAVPVSIRTGEEEDTWTNRVSSLVAPLPTHLEDPAERLKFAHEAMDEAKESFQLIPADALQDFSQFSPPAVFTQAAGLMTRLRMGDRMATPVNLIISNVPGPRHALYLGPAKLVHYYPVSAIGEGQGLNITVQSYEDKLDFGVVGDRTLVPDVWDLVDMMIDELDDLVALVAPSDETDPAPEAAPVPPAADAPDTGSTSDAPTGGNDTGGTGNGDATAASAPAPAPATDKAGDSNHGAGKAGAKKTGARKAGTKKSGARKTAAKKRSTKTSASKKAPARGAAARGAGDGTA
ncbi:MAG: wax ester/triacylglycerol synthase family O-acyltransferase [Acidimicrobiales bacterium]